MSCSVATAGFFDVLEAGLLAAAVPRLMLLVFRRVAVAILFVSKSARSVVSTTVANPVWQA
jgi:hypothetical protein